MTSVWFHVFVSCLPAALVEPGYYAQQLKKVGLLTPELQADPRWELFNVALNNIILNFTQWESVLLFVRDVGHTMTEVNLSTSAHRLARFIKKERVRQPWQVSPVSSGHDLPGSGARLAAAAVSVDKRAPFAGVGGFGRPAQAGLSEA